MKPHRFLPTIAKLLLAGSMLALIGCSSADGDEANSTNTARHDGVSANGLSIDRARIEDDGEKLEVEGETPDEDQRVFLRILDQNGNSIFEDDEESDDDKEYEFEERPAPFPSCVAEVTLGGTTLTLDIEDRPDVCDNPQQVNECDIAVSPTTLAFGDVIVGNSPTLNTTVSNNGNATCSVDLNRSGSDDFDIRSDTNFNLAPGGSQTVTVRYQPGQVGADNGTVEVNSNDPDTATVDVALSGNGVVQQVNECNISVSPLALSFGDVTVGNSSTLSTSVSNSGNAACDVTLAINGSNDFAVASNTSFNVSPGGSQTVSVDYTPGQAGADTATLAVNSNDPDSSTVNVGLSGNGVQQQVNQCNIAVSPLALSFGDVTVGNSPTLSATVNNSGNAVCNVTLVRNGSNDFAIVGNTSFNISSGGSQTVSVSYTPGEAGADAGNVAVNSDDPDSPTINIGLSGNGVLQQVQCNPVTQDLSINSTSQDGCPEQTVPEVATVLNSAFRVLAINDLGMHCGDLDTRISSILPPFQVLLGQVIQRGATPTLNPAGVTLEYSAASNPADPILGMDPAIVQRGLKADGSTYKTNFWDVARNAYDPFYPAGILPLFYPEGTDIRDIGLPVPNPEELYIGADGVVLSGDETLHAVQHAMPGLTNPYLDNTPQSVQEHFGDKPFFLNFPFGYVAENVNWYEGAGIPFAAYDDFGRENAYPLVRVEAKQGANTVATVDTVLPISGEASCTNCHSDPADVQNSRTSQPTDTLTNAGLPVATSLDDPDPNLPLDVSVEYAADINILRLHDLKHGANYVDPDGNATPCDVSANTGNGDANCLINQALVQGKPTVCQVCHYTPALDLAQVGPQAGAVGTPANGRNQLAHSSNSNVMHSHHGGLGNLFPPMPAPNQDPDGTITNQAERLAVLEDTCYQCHPGTNVQCLRGAMFNGGMLCNDCHGNMEQVGNDFSAGVSPQNPGAFVLGGDFYNPNDPQPRVPWANEPGCGSCHTGDVQDNLAGTANTIANTRDIDGNVDNLRLRQAYVTGDAKATPIVPTNKRFAEPAVPATFANADGSTFANPGAGNPQLYRVSTGHGGVMCEGCHGATHAEFPNGNPNANDNVMANQLQGHTGPIVECDTCHTNINALGTDGSTNSLQGPHGMHVVGNTLFADGEHRRNINRNACRDCHGQNGEGSVLSRTAADRNLPDVGFVAKGTPITCTMCHGNEL